MTFQKIAILVKQVPDHEAIVQIESDSTLSIEERYVCSFFDEIAVEAALAIKNQHPDVQLKAFSAGGKRAIEALKRAMAMGVDQVEQIGDEGMDGADSLMVATALASALGKYQPDLVLCGKLACDDDMGAIGPMVSALMGIPVVGGAVALDVDPGAGKVTIVRKLEGESWTVEAGLPVVITAEKGLAEPHVPVVMRVMKAMRAKVPAVSLQDLGLQLEGGRVSRLGYHNPPTRPQVKMVSSVEELAGILQQRGVLS